MARFTGGFCIVFNYRNRRCEIETFVKTYAVRAFLTILIFAGPSCGLAVASADQCEPSGIAVETIASGLEHPWASVELPDGRWLVTERAGRLVAIANDGRRTFIGTQELPPLYHGGINGLMDIVLDPDFSDTRAVYLSMSYGEATANGTRLLKARLEGDRLTDITVLFDSTPKGADGNNGGRISFLPDGSLILTLGDGTEWREEAQNLQNHLGKVIRLERDGGIPEDNPFVGRSDVAPEIFSFGHRNVQGAAVDPLDGSLLITEHGPRGGDEINLVHPGANYGWPVVTGGLDYSFARVSPFKHLEGFEPAVLEWTPSIAPAGLAIYRASLFSGWDGDLLVPALKERTLRRVIRKDGEVVGQELLLADLKERMRDVKVGADGAVYVLTDGPEARLLRLAPGDKTPN